MHVWCITKQKLSNSKHTPSCWGNLQNWNNRKVASQSAIVSDLVYTLPSHQRTADATYEHVECLCACHSWHSPSCHQAPHGSHVLQRSVTSGLQNQGQAAGATPQSHHARKRVRHALMDLYSWKLNTCHHWNIFMTSLPLVSGDTHRKHLLVSAYFLVDSLLTKF